MSMPLEQMMPTSELWCGRSWEGLMDRRCLAFAQAEALRSSSDTNASQVVTDFLEFFDATGDSLLRDEEEWIFRSFEPAPEPVRRALKEHMRISSLVTSLFHAANAGCIDVRVVRGLGDLLQSHLLLEEEEIRPLISGPRPLLSLGS